MWKFLRLKMPAIRNTPQLKGMDTISRIRQGIRSHQIATILVIAAFLIFATLVLASQNRIVGWEPGYDRYQPDHHGFVSSHTLGIISRATVENAFVGFAEHHQREEFYFDRYPVFFSVSMNAVLSVSDRLSSKVYIAKQIMNLIFLATVFICFLLVNKFGVNKLAALGVAILAVTSEYLIFYKDMVHFDQPGLLGFFFLIYAIALYRVEHIRWPVYLVAIFAISFGRGYSSYAILLTWFLVESILILRNKDLQLSEKLKRILIQDVTKVIIITVILGAIFLSYNISTESRSREIPILETSIIAAAEDRLALSQEFNQTRQQFLRWDNFGRDQLDNLIKWSTPLKLSRIGFIPSIIVLTVVLTIIGIYIFRQPNDIKVVLIITLLSGPVWILGMRNLTAFHDYTSMFYLGIPLLFYTSVFSLLDIEKWKFSGAFILLVSLVVFIKANNRVQDLHFELGRYQNVYTHDFMRIREVIEGTDNIISLRTDIPHTVYGLSFYLPEQRLDYTADPDYIITGNRDSYPETLTPDNKQVFLFYPHQ